MSVASPFYKNWSNITYFKISGKFSFFTPQPLKTFVRVQGNRVEHDFNWNVFKRTGFSFRESFNDFYYYFYYLLSCVCVCITLSCVWVHNIKSCVILLFSEFPSKSKYFLEKIVDGIHLKLRCYILFRNISRNFWCTLWIQYLWWTRFLIRLELILGKILEKEIFLKRLIIWGNLSCLAGKKECSDKNF